MYASWISQEAELTVFGCRSIYLEHTLCITWEANVRFRLIIFPVSCILQLKIFWISPDQHSKPGPAVIHKGANITYDTPPKGVLAHDTLYIHISRTPGAVSYSNQTKTSSVDFTYMCRLPVPCNVRVKQTTKHLAVLLSMVEWTKVNAPILPLKPEHNMHLYCNHYAATGINNTVW